MKYYSRLKIYKASKDRASLASVRALQLGMAIAA
jgi:hypothetical protein